MFHYRKGYIRCYVYLTPPYRTYTPVRMYAILLCVIFQCIISADATSLNHALLLHSSSVSGSAMLPAPSNGPHDVYRAYYGNGSTGDGWPAQTAWVSFDYMYVMHVKSYAVSALRSYPSRWHYNVPNMKMACAQWGVPDDSDEELACMKTSIQQVARSTEMDPRFILAIILQESTGCVRVITTANAHPNPGLMQSFNGKGTCNTNTASLGIPGVNGTGIVRTPCPGNQIYQMILDGTNGTEWGGGLRQDYQSQRRTDVSGVYRTARLYNGGSLQADGNLIGPCCLPSYASDIANRLMGWVNAPSSFGS